MWHFVCIWSSQILSGRYGKQISFSCIFQDIIHFESVMGGSFFVLLLVFFKNDLLLFLLLLDHLLVHTVHFWKVDHPFTIGKRRDIPLSFLVIPAGVIEDVLELILIHEDVDDSCILFYFFLLIPNRIKQFLLFILVLVLKIFQLYQV